MTYQNIIKESCRRYFNAHRPTGPYQNDELMNTPVDYHTSIKSKLTAQAVTARKTYFPRDDIFYPHECINDYEYLMDAYQRMSYQLAQLKV